MLAETGKPFIAKEYIDDKYLCIIYVIFIIKSHNYNYYNILNFQILKMVNIVVQDVPYSTICTYTASNKHLCQIVAWLREIIFLGNFCLTEFIEFYENLTWVYELAVSRG